MSRQGSPLFAAVFLAMVMASAGCNSVDLKTQVQVVDVSSGYYDNGLTPTGLNHLVPSITFSLRNISDREVSSIDMVVMYWAQGDDAEKDEALLRVIGGGGLPAGANVRTVVSRARVGFTLATARRGIVQSQWVQGLDRQVLPETRRQDRARRRIQDRAQVAAQRAYAAPK